MNKFIELLKEMKAECQRRNEMVDRGEVDLIAVCCDCKYRQKCDLAYTIADYLYDSSPFNLDTDAIEQCFKELGI